MNVRGMGRLVAATLAISSVAMCQLAPAGAASGVLLRYSFKAGQSASYAVSVTSSRAVLTQKISVLDRATLTQRVMKTYADGSATLQDSYSKSTLTSYGIVAPLNVGGISVTQRVARNGAVLSTATRGITQTNGFSYLGGGFDSRPVLPTTAVSVGQSWTATQQISLGHLGVFSLSQRFTLTGMKSQGGHQIAQIQVSGSQPVHLVKNNLSESGSYASSGSLQFDTTSGALVALHEQVKQLATIMPAAGGTKAKPVTFSFTATVDVVKIS